MHLGEAEMHVLNGLIFGLHLKIFFDLIFLVVVGVFEV
jgi:hypothetical protein